MRICNRNLLIILSVVTQFFISNKALSQAKTKKWRLVWSDEFNYVGVPDPNKWGYELGYIRDYEKQFYTNSPSNAYVSHGKLAISGRKEKYVNPSIQQFRKKFGNITKNLRELNQDSLPAYVKNRYDSVVNITSASLVTLGKMHWKYGKFEFRAKLPKGLGVWPIIWMMGINRKQVQWPACGEIDIMEHIGRYPKSLFGNFHYEGQVDKLHKSHGKSIEMEDLSLKFHTYAMIWDSEKITLYCDGKAFHSLDIASLGDNNNPYRKDFYLLISLALGGTFAGELDESILPQEFLIDYVRIYQ